MNRTRLLAVGTILMLALTAVAQQTPATPGGPAPGASSDTHDGGVPTVEAHLKALSEKLDLTGDQQAKTKPILQELNDATMKLRQDESMSHDERLGKVRAAREKADKQLREFLNDDQKKKLDQLEQEPHPDLHGDGNAATPPQAPKN
jgi:Spy/CpxP family protein refolding chaperone